MPFAVYGCILSSVSLFVLIIWKLATLPHRSVDLAIVVVYVWFLSDTAPALAYSRAGISAPMRKCGQTLPQIIDITKVLIKLVSAIHNIIQVVSNSTRCTLYILQSRRLRRLIPLTWPHRTHDRILELTPILRQILIQKLVQHDRLAITLIHDNPLLHRSRRLRNRVFLLSDLSSCISVWWNLIHFDFNDEINSI